MRVSKIHRKERTGVDIHSSLTVNSVDGDTIIEKLGRLERGPQSASKLKDGSDITERMKEKRQNFYDTGREGEL